MSSNLHRDAITVLTRKKIPVKYSLKQHSELNWLNLTAIKYSYAVSDPDLNSGSHTVHMMNLSGADLQLCYGDRAALNNALRDAITVLTRKKIPVKYSLKQHSEVSNHAQQLNWLNLTAIKYSYAVSDPDLNSGSHTVHMMNLSGADLQLCYGDRAALNNALRFGTFYQRKCKLYVKDILSMKRTEIFELFLSYRDENGKPTLYTIPVLINTHLKSDMSTWQLVRRFFLVDNMLGVSSLDSNSGPSVIRYVKSATLR
ncbi:uncharacterized protein LOC113470220 [Diaphorina citri]|uniref:Uncharacterized protein LOC113470220 n=1 Tax=Diaphorina citri TaxID=121845 RepID=A0A3Q0J743_DIACI|nr:uncharacterized protein LOC113470220 [Diaphorina citri]